MNKWPVCHKDYSDFWTVCDAPCACLGSLAAGRRFAQRLLGQTQPVFAFGPSPPGSLCAQHRPSGNAQQRHGGI